jgi:DNA-binding transcriptional ArsR family regulator
VWPNLAGVIRLRFSVEDLGQVRFAISPLWEAVTSLRTLTAGSPTGLHAPWLAQVRRRLDDHDDLNLLTTVVRPAGYLPDFLHPIPPRRAASFDTSLRSLAATDPRLVATELAHLAQHPIAMRGPGRVHRRAVLDDLIADPRSGLARIVAALDGHWRVSIAPHWPRMRALLHADIAHRLQELAAGGVRQLFRTLQPAVSFTRDTLSVVNYYDATADLRRRGLLLIPCVFAWPDVIVRTADPQPAVTYSPRGLGRLWESHPGTSDSALAGVLGDSRAAILAQLDLPMSTTHLAGQLGLAAPTVNAHLKALSRAGIVASHRDGHNVLYRRTALGDQLIAAAAPQ